MTPRPRVAPEFQTRRCPSRASSGTASRSVALPDYYVFDLPFADGRDLRGLPLLERKRRLAALVEGRSKAVRFSDHLEAEAEDALAHACRLGLEGLIGKRADADYVRGRTRT